MCFYLNSSFNSEKYAAGNFPDLLHYQRNFPCCIGPRATTYVTVMPRGSNQNDALI